MIARIALLLGVGGLFTALYLAGFFEFIQQPERVRTALDDLGLWGPVLFVLAFACLEPFFVPGLAFIIPGAIVWTFEELFLLSWLGSMGAGIVGFSFARFIGRDYVSRHLPARLHQYDQSLITNGLRTVILVRLTLFLAPPAHWLLGLSKVRFSTFVLGTAIGFLPGLAVVTYVTVVLGESLGAWLSSRPPAVWIGIALAIAAVAIVRRRRKRARPAVVGVEKVG